MQTIWDPLRKKEVALTPEEQVRQWFVTQLRDVAGVPVSLMNTEVGFKFGDKQYRADILIFGRDGSPLAVVECKRPDVTITREVVDQAMRYNAVLSVRFIFLTNGNTTYIFKRTDTTATLDSCPDRSPVGSDTFIPLEHFPSFNDMI